MKGIESYLGYMEEELQKLLDTFLKPGERFRMENSVKELQI